MSADDPAPTALLYWLGTDPSLRAQLDPFLPASVQVRELTDRAALLAACTQGSPDLVLLGGRLEANDAIELCAELSHSGTRAAVLVTVDESAMDRALSAGAADCIGTAESPRTLAHRMGLALRHRRAQCEASLAAALLALTQKTARVGTFLYSPPEKRLRFSAQASKALGWSEERGESVDHADVLAIVRENARTTFAGWLDQAASGTKGSPIECEVAHHGGKPRIVRFELASVDFHPASGRWIAGTLQDVSPRREAEQRLQVLLAGDTTFGGAERQRFLDKLGQALASAQPPRSKVAVIAVRASFPEGCGEPHEEREARIAALGSRIKECVRDRDSLGHMGTHMRDISLTRTGSEQFAILLPALVQPPDAFRVARRIQHDLVTNASSEWNGAKPELGFGIAIHPDDAAGAEDLLRAAETAMHTANEDENGIRFFTATMNISALERRSLETNLRRAIERDELLVYYQPRVDIKSGRIMSFEALVRWKHPELGLISPAQFIPVAEETGLIIPIGEYVMAQACEQNKRWQDEGRPPVRVAVNLSSVQFMEPELEARVKRVLEHSGLAPDWLELEITESLLLNKVEATIETLQHIKQTGVHVAIDDFGTGYSSLAYLKRLPIDALKIDQSFIRDVVSNPDDAAITTSIILMGKSLKLRVVAEGVETRSQLAFLRVLECDEAQGYLFSRPLPAAEAGALLSAGISATLLA
ncbi:MAG: putative bifunctional diguanylate cyclase/phosphodiesterase [Planctomycetota bacterium]